VAINSAIEVALDGSANLELLGGELISGPGGAPDYAFGASVSNGGRHITALKATAGGGTITRVVGRIEPPRPVTLPAWLADVVVTEHGRAEIRALAGPDRALALAATAHPDHRPVLEQLAAEAGPRPLPTTEPGR
jgi:acyl-CoA hydrolase